MKEKIVTTCPACGSTLHIAKLECQDCGTIIEGDFARSRFEMLPEKDLEFIELFLEKRGNIKAVGKELDLSYPTVKNRLNQALISLGFEESDDDLENEESEDTIEILNKISEGEISAGEAIIIINSKKEEKR